MSAVTASQISVTIIWDDSVVLVFSFQDSNNNTQYCGFPHLVPAWQSQSGKQTQISATVQSITQAGVQVSADPATWVDTVKYGARGNKISVVYDDTINVNYTTQTAQPYQLQQLYSIHG
jgi:hypothetical protein